MPSEVIRLMEVCGTHTMAIAKSGIRSLLPPSVKLLSGPGCPVCVTPSGQIDAVLALSAVPNLIITTYGDMLRVPGSKRGDNLALRRAKGADVRIVYSAMDAVSIARENPGKEVLFLGVGFETTSPGTAAAVGAAAEEDLKNFSVFSTLKMVEPAIRTLASDPDFAVDGFLAPGHVAVILGEEGFAYIPEELHLPAVIGGFERGELLHALALLIKQVRAGEHRLENAYTSVVRPEGNPAARALMDKYLVPRTDVWRGLGTIENSGLGIRPEYAAFDAETRFDLSAKQVPDPPGCRCGEVICGKCTPAECPLFGRACTPEDPVGPCMVSSEGSCAAAYRYRAAV